MLRCGGIPTSDKGIWPSTASGAVLVDSVDRHCQCGGGIRLYFRQSVATLQFIRAAKLCRTGAAGRRGAVARGQPETGAMDGLPADLAGCGGIDHRRVEAPEPYAPRNQVYRSIIIIACRHVFLGLRRVRGLAFGEFSLGEPGKRDDLGKRAIQLLRNTLPNFHPL